MHLSHLPYVFLPVIPLVGHLFIQKRTDDLVTSFQRQRCCLSCRFVSALMGICGRCQSGESAHSWETEPSVCEAETSSLNVMARPGLIRYTSMPQGRSLSWSESIWSFIYSIIVNLKSGRRNGDRWWGRSRKWFLLVLVHFHPLVPNCDCRAGHSPKCAREANECISLPSSVRTGVSRIDGWLARNAVRCYNTALWMTVLWIYGLQKRVL